MVNITQRGTTNWHMSPVIDSFSAACFYFGEKTGAGQVKIFRLQRLTLVFHIAAATELTDIMWSNETVSGPPVPIGLIESAVGGTMIEVQCVMLDQYCVYHSCRRNSRPGSQMKRWQRAARIKPVGTRVSVGWHLGMEHYTTEWQVRPTPSARALASDAARYVFRFCLSSILQ